jgi:alkanesulfonate monooxygenase SsuD/methylene tetrahydromethanopterin reductase-like flavin-dependent oxidoreductase (luciferase family)
MHFGGAMFFTDYSMSAPELARALEERGFESVWAPEHSHIPLSRKTPFPGGGDLPMPYYDAMDPFVVLAAAAQATKTINSVPAWRSFSSATRSRPPSWSPRSTR